jgi:flagellar operon protein
MNDLALKNIGPARPIANSGEETALRGGGVAGEFGKALRSKLPGPAANGPAEGASPLRFSAHALNRIKDRSISLGTELMGKLEKAVDTAAQKGSRESLILTDNAAFVVSVKNKTVITVLDRDQMNGNVFTNIDSTVVI